MADKAKVVVKKTNGQLLEEEMREELRTGKLKPVPDSEDMFVTDNEDADELEAWLNAYPSSDK